MLEVLALSVEILVDELSPHAAAVVRLAGVVDAGINGVAATCANEQLLVSLPRSETSTAR